VRIIYNFVVYVKPGRGGGLPIVDAAMAASPADVERALAALRSYETMALATVSADGPHVAGVFFAPADDGDGGIRLLLAVLRDSRKHRELLGDPRVAFVCSPGRPVRWVQGSGLARMASGAEGDAVLRGLEAHSSEAAAFVGRLPVAPVVVEVRSLKVVEELGRPALVLELGPSRSAR
jgi:Pyridoxamine 5'-phosphate oxidase